MCRSVQVAFTRTPSVQSDLRLLGGNMTSLPFLEDWLQGTLRSLLEPYTLPDKVLCATCWNRDIAGRAQACST